jgi:uncharacterized membrane protein YfcA
MPEKAEKPKPQVKKGDEEATGIKKVLLMFSKDSRLQLLVLAPLVGLLVGLFAFGLGTCFGPVLVPIVVIAIPYYMGIKQTIKLLKVGLLALIVGGLFMALIYGMVIYDRSDLLGPGYVTSSDGIIAKASVSPLKGLPGETYNFTLEVSKPKVLGANVTVYFRARDYLSERRSLGFNAEIVFNESATKLNITDFYKNIKLGIDTVYFAEFFVHVTNGSYDHWTTTDYGLLVIASSSLGNVVASMLPMTMFNLVLFPYGMIFLLFLSVLWWMRKSKERRTEIEREADELEKEEMEAKKMASEAEFACTSCGAPVKEEDPSCPKCGAKFEEKEEHPKENEEPPKKDEKK